ncbi:MAG: histidinol phosphatase [Clostridium sp.]|uniref:histidinol phosphatase n=1 Tax=Clostridium sp. TaxID=1506 RepID=UPI003F3C524D
MPNITSEKNINNFINEHSFYYGFVHTHSSYSIGNHSPLECFNLAYRSNLHFLMISDHSDFLDQNSEKWNKALEQTYRLNKKRENFTAIYGFEGKSEALGDLNILNSNTFFKGTLKDLKLLPLWMIKNRDAILIISNPLKPILSHDYHPIIKSLLSCIEVTSGLNNRYIRRDKYYLKLLDKGLFLSPVNGLTEAKLNFSDTENLTCIISNKNTKEALLQAIRLRRVYCTESRTLQLMFFINNHFMGDFIERSSVLNFTILVEDKNYFVNRIDIISSGGNVIHSIKDLQLKKIRYLYNHIPAINEDWYVLKIYQETDKISISSPIFIKKNPKV